MTAFASVQLLLKSVHYALALQDPCKYFHDLILIEIEIKGNLIFISHVIMIS